MTDPRAIAPACFTDLCSDAGCAHRVTTDGARWFITMGHPGFNSPANNRGGYVSADAAQAASARYGARRSR